MADFRALLEAAFTGDPERIRIEAEHLGIRASFIQEVRRSVVCPKGYGYGYDEGYDDGYDEGYDDGYDRGYADGVDSVMAAP